MGIIVLDPKKNANTKLLPNPDCIHMQKQHVSSITLKEFSRAASSFPIVLIKNKETGQYNTAVMLGLEQNENLYYNKDQWKCNYAPLSILHHPFILGRDENDAEPNRLTTCLLDDTPFVSETEGQALYKEDGKPTELLTHYFGLLRELFEGEKATNTFIEKLKELDLIVPFTLETVSAAGNKRQLTGLHMVENTRVAALSAEKVQELHKLDYFRAIHAMDISLGNMVTMIKHKNDTLEDKIMNFQLTQ